MKNKLELINRTKKKNISEGQLKGMEEVKDI